MFVTKGTDEIKPLICAHIDTVHKKTKINIKEEWLPRLSCYGQIYPYDENVLCLKGYDDNGEETGCGGDDKCGVYVCLEILDRVDNIKLALFVSEETGCIGSSNCEPEFFENTKFVISYDSPGNQLVTEIYKEVPPMDTCNRPESVASEPGYMKLSPGHYGCFLAHKNGISLSATFADLQ
jgi:putative aminopeptidase FrvX